LLIVVVGGKGATLESGGGSSVETSVANPGGIVGVLGMVVAAKMLANCLIAMACLMLMQGSGDGEEGRRRAATRSLAAAMAGSVVLDAVGMTTWLGNQVKVSAMHSAQVSLTQTL
jgi:hypothetical protein